MKRTLLLFLTALLLALLAGCAGEPLPTESAAPSSEVLPSEETPPEALVFDGKSYPLDVESLSVGPYELQQLRWATGLKELHFSGHAPESWDFLASLTALETLQISLAAGTDPAELPLDGYALPALKSLQISAECPVGTLSLPQAAVESCTVELSAVKSLDFSKLTAGEVQMVLSAAPETLIFGSVQSLSCEGFAPDVASLQALPVSELSLTEAQPLDFVAEMSSLEHLRLSGSGWELAPLAQSGLLRLSLSRCGGDLSMLTQSSIEHLILPDASTETVASLAGMASLHTLQVSDAAAQDLAVLETLPNLETLFLNVASQSAAIGNGELKDAALLDELETPIPLEQLKSFLQRGGTLWLYQDPNR